MLDALELRSFSLLQSSVDAFLQDCADLTPNPNDEPPFETPSPLPIPDDDYGAHDFTPSVTRSAAATPSNSRTRSASASVTRSRSGTVSLSASTSRTSSVTRSVSPTVSDSRSVTRTVSGVCQRQRIVCCV